MAETALERTDPASDEVAEAVVGQASAPRRAAIVSGEAWAESLDSPDNANVRTDRIKRIGPETAEEHGELLSMVHVEQVRQVGWEGDGLVGRHAGHPDLGESDPAVAEVPLRVALTGGHDLDIEE